MAVSRTVADRRDQRALTRPEQLCHAHQELQDHEASEHGRSKALVAAIEPDK